MNLKRLANKIKDVTVLDYLSFFPMLLGLMLSPFYKNKYKNTWAICERKNEARDNGFHLFRYLCLNHSEQDCIYAINKKCDDYRKVADIGKTVQYGSIKHWVLYFTCKYLISSQDFKPNGYLCTFFERAGMFHPDHVFLQHGITKDIPDFLLASNRRAKYFIAGAEPEYKFMKEEFGYPEGTIQYTGFARFDALHNIAICKNRILVMPTWRKWLKLKSETHDDAKMGIESSDYLYQWQNLLQSEEFNRLIVQFDLEVIFYPHPNMIGLMKPENIVGKGVKIVDTKCEDLQGLLKSSQLLITDFSSVFFDFAYMKKPIVFYQFDEEMYRKYHYKQGWYDYHSTAFGKSCKNASEVLSILKQHCENSFVVSDSFLAEHSRTFPLYDSCNCKRIFELLNG